MRTLIALAAAAAMTTGCVIVVDGDDDDWDDGKRDSFRMNLVADYSGPFKAAQTHELSSFEKIDASAGTDVTVVHGDRFEIRLDDRAIGRTSYQVRGNTLKISCDRPCGNGSRGSVEVMAPSLSAIEVSSGAHLEVSEGFEESRLNLSASSGARLDASMLAANSASASASSGASIQLSASDHLSASASSGARIRYNGNPDSVNVSESSGGSIKKH
ncbi:GIN domain-containing protein [Parvularcula marina]|uniref:Putative auto-transporter adhesin head GIN domain-containing protein n=1 Tax=Parvularcula marina TaxID=2292771 RepID=A0A371RFM0_9PROT|nr:DUF2807 domain-containing protein [Parvularcula marina]RFB04248.1 hypothetical protein DX908_02475 [Parvularcula marina]